MINRTFQLLSLPTSSICIFRLAALWNRGDKSFNNTINKPLLPIAIFSLNPLLPSCLSSILSLALLSLFHLIPSSFHFFPTSFHLLLSILSLLSLSHFFLFHLISFLFFFFVLFSSFISFFLFSTISYPLFFLSYFFISPIVAFFISCLFFYRVFSFSLNLRTELLFFGLGFCTEMKMGEKKDG